MFKMGQESESPNVSSRIGDEWITALKRLNRDHIHCSAESLG